MIIDKKENLLNYSALGIPAQKILDFIENIEQNEVQEGRYDIVGDDLFALVQKYETKDPKICYPESHFKYIDIQYIVNGSEMLICDFSDEIKVTEDKSPEADIRFHEKGYERATVKLDKQMYAILFPQDAHTPGLRNGLPSQIHKIVFKIKI